MIDYLTYKNNVYSENGEDGILEKLIQDLYLTVSKDFWVCDIGAWDGKKISNVYHLIENGASGVLIEEENTEEKYKALEKLAKENERIIPVNVGISWKTEGNAEEITRREYLNDPDKTLDKVLSETPIPKDFDVLNIDTDTADHEIWETVTDYRPKIVITEINSNIPRDSVTSGEIGDNKSYNESIEYADKMGYSLVCSTGIMMNIPIQPYAGNMIYVRNDLFELIK
tara:strand:+ start:21534 stop:22214 length:681 start_codon:yes stop_codon:yes gene_type:complete